MPLPQLLPAYGLQPDESRRGFPTTSGFHEPFQSQANGWDNPRNTALRYSCVTGPLLSFEHGAAARFPALLFQCSIALSKICVELGLKLLELNADLRKCNRALKQQGGKTCGCPVLEGEERTSNA